MADTSGFAIIDRISNVTVGTGIVRGLAELSTQKPIVNMSYEERLERLIMKLIC